METNMTDEQVKAIMAAILIGSERIAKAALSAHGHCQGVPLTETRAIEVATSILKKT